MDKVLGLNRSKKLVWTAWGLVFVFMLALNCLTPYVADDYVYMGSFANGERLHSLSGVIQSMYRHCFTMNGRVVSHFFGQLFMLWPKLVFNICNALVYTVLMALLYRIANYGRKENLLLFAAICAAFWRYVPDYGQVSLWQLGSVNYLWGLLAGMGYLSPFLLRFLRGKDPMPRLWQRVLFCLGALLFGMYTEVTSFIGLFLAFLLLAAAPVMKRAGWRTWLWLPLGLAAAGYVILLSMPAEMAAKQAAMTLGTLISNFKRSTFMLQAYGKELLLIWVVLFLLGFYARVPAERMVLSFFFALGAAAANYMLIMASYFPDRCCCTTIMLLILASAVLAADLSFSRFSPLCACGGGALAVLVTFSLIFGVGDIWSTYRGFQEREAIIEEHLAAGETDLELQLLYPSTWYSALYGLRDLSTEEAATWPNQQMASYYGIHSILGLP